MRYRYGVSLCISTQVGCRMGCRFCASTLEGRVRDLTAGEMLGEILCANRFLEAESAATPSAASIPAATPSSGSTAASPSASPSAGSTTAASPPALATASASAREASAPLRVSHVVLMGSGEPLDNYDEVIRFLRLLKEEEGIRLSLRNVSLSTCGIVPKMYDLAEEGLPVTLCVSLHAPTDEIRRQTMPIAYTWSIREILEACRNYIRKTGRRVIFEYALTEGVNASEADASELADRLRGMQCHVNLIPLNAVPERNLKGVSEETVRRFMQVLEDKHISVTRRREMGDDIEGACGQLRRKTINGTESGDAKV